MLYKSKFYKNSLLLSNFGATAFVFPTTTYIALYVANFNATASTPGYWAAAITVTAGTYVSPSPANGQLYVCTVGGVTGSAQPTWPTAIGATVVDNTATWTEATEYLIGFNTAYPPIEVSGGGYARQPITNAQWAAPSASPDQLGEQVSNSVALAYAAPTTSWGLVCAAASMTALTAGNTLYGTSPISSYITVVAGNPAPSIPIGDLSVEEI